MGVEGLVLFVVMVLLYTAIVYNYFSGRSNGSVGSVAGGFPGSLYIVDSDVAARVCGKGILGSAIRCACSGATRFSGKVVLVGTATAGSSKSAATVGFTCATSKMLVTRERCVGSNRSCTCYLRRQDLRT